MISSSVILDLVILGIFLLCVWLGARKGLFRSLAELLASLAALVGASWAAGQFAQAAVGWLRPLLESSVSQAIEQYLAGIAGEEGYTGILADLLGRLTGQLSPDGIAGVAVDAMVDSVLYNIAYALLFLAAFVLLMIVLKIVIRAVDTVLKLPVLHQVNTLGGLLFGALEGLLLILLLLWLEERTGLLVDSRALDASLIAPHLVKLLP